MESFLVWVIGLGAAQLAQDQLTTSDCQWHWLGEKPGLTQLMQTKMLDLESVFK